jgi:nitric oxide reductase NorQ protein
MAHVSRSARVLTRETDPNVASDRGEEGRAEASASQASPPYYAPVRDEVEIFEAAYAERLPMLLRGPTGCGKTRFVRHMAARLGRPLVTVACHEDLTASDLVGRFLVRGGDTVWQDGPLTRAVRTGAICYLDELVEARQDTVVVIHPLTDDRRELAIEKRDELLPAHPGFVLVVSYNPAHQDVLKQMKASTRQRFVSLAFEYPPADVEAAILVHEAGVDAGLAARLVEVGRHVRRLRDEGLSDAPSTRVLVQAGRLIRRGVEPVRACRVAIAESLTDEPELVDAITRLIGVVFA